MQFSDKNQIITCYHKRNPPTQERTETPHGKEASKEKENSHHRRRTGYHRNAELLLSKQGL